MFPSRFATSLLLVAAGVLAVACDDGPTGPAFGPGINIVTGAAGEIGDEICATAREISSDVNGIILTCETLIANARSQIAAVFAAPPPVITPSPAQRVAPAAAIPPVDSPGIEMSTTVERVYAHNRSKTYYPEGCAGRPDDAYLMAKSLAVRQGYRLAEQCRK